MIQKKRNNRRKRGGGFNPTHNYIDEAVSYFLANGGRIIKLEFDENSFNNFFGDHGNTASDEFLNGDGA